MNSKFSVPDTPAPVAPTTEIRVVMSKFELGKCPTFIVALVAVKFW